MKSFKKGWIVFGEYCRKNNIPQKGYHTRLLEKLDSKYKENITPTSRNITYAVYEKEADKIFLKNI